MRRAVLIVALVAGLALSGCGIPDETTVVPLGPGPSTGVSAGDDRTPTHSGRADTTDKAQFIENYLDAAAGDFAGASDRARQFMSPDWAVNFKVSADVKVVRQTEDPLVEPGSPEVNIKVREVGTLNQKGILVPATDDQVDTYRFTVRELSGQQGLFITRSPEALMISETALDRFYAQRTIYFWNQAGTGLVPDLRYLPRSVPFEQQPTVIIDWLTSGPAPWLAGVVDPLPDGTKPIGNVPAIRNGTLQISLSDQAVPADDPTAVDRLQKQLRWSLRPNLPATLELSVERQPQHRYTGTDYLVQNPAYREIDQAERFVVYGGEIHRLTRSYRADQPVPVLTTAANKGVHTAALATSGSRSYAALVIDETDDRLGLRVGAAGPGEQARLRRIGGLPAPIGRPVWATSPVGADAGTIGLVTAGGKLWSFRPDGGSAREVEWTGGPRGVTAVAVAPDAHRVALVAGGRLYVAALSTGEDGAQLSSPVVAVHTILRNLTVVDWGSERMLVVAGTRPASNRVAMMDVSIDGATQTDRLADLGTTDVTHLATLPADPVGAATTGPVAYVQAGAAYDEVARDQLQARDLADPPTTPPAGLRPDAPFFLN